MNPITAEQLPPAPQAPQGHRNSSSCERHPDEHFTGFCPSCLYERLSVLDKTSSSSSTTTTLTSGRKSASSAIKSLFKPTNNDGGPSLRGKPSSTSFLPELRRTKSFSCGKNDGGFLGFSGGFEPQRRSCDVRGRSTLFSLFSQDNNNNNNNDKRIPVINDPCSSSVVIELKTDVAEEFHVLQEGNNGDEIQVLEEEIVVEPSGIIINSEEEKEEKEEVVYLKPMKEHMDLDSQNKKVGSKDLKELAGSFWSAASVFSKKLRGWTRKNKMKKHMNMNGAHTVQVSGKKGNNGRNYRDTQSEIADYGFGRRSCDTDPRFSIDAGRFSVDAAMAGRYSVDAGRVSFDDARCSFDEPRASWDGYLIGRNFPKMMPPMLSVVEDAPAPVSVPRKDAYIQVEEPRRSSVSINGEDYIPGGAAQTKDYYSDSSSRRRRSLDRSSSIRKTAASVVAEMDEMKNVPAHAPVPVHVHVPPPCVGSGDRDVRELDFHSNSNSVRDDYSESFDMRLRDNASVVGKGLKKSRRWRAWNIWGLIYRRGASNKDDDEERSTIPNGVERSYSESWQHLRDQRVPGLGPVPGPGFYRNGLRSNSSVSWRNSNGSFGRKHKDEFVVLERNRSARYSPNHGADNGMLRFYLAPMKGSRRGGSSGKPKPAYSHSFARSVLRLY